MDIFIGFRNGGELKRYMRNYMPATVLAATFDDGVTWQLVQTYTYMHLLALFRLLSELIDWIN